MKTLVLFDIDGTLLAGGPAKGAFHEALLEVYGTAGPIHTHEFSGKTDPQIARELLTEDGLDPDWIDAGFTSLWEGYLRRLGARLPESPMRVLPAVPELIAALSEESDVAIGLVTGNILGGAELKLSSAGLPTWEVGAFGSDHEVRNHLPGIAIDRAAGRWGIRFPPERVVVVGDTPRDVACGQAHGTRTVGVATGRYSADALAGAGADAVFPDFSEVDRVVRTLIGP